MARGLILVQIDKDNIRIFRADDKSDQRVKFPPEIMDNLEVKEPVSYRKWWVNLWQKINLKKNKLFIIMGRDTLFFKPVATTDMEEKFWTEVPLDPINTIRRTIKLGDEMIAMAVNEELFYPAIETAKEAGGQIEGVYPELVFTSVNPEERLNQKRPEGDINLWKEIKKESAGAEKTDSGKRNNFKPVAGLFGILILVSAIYFGVRYVRQTDTTHDITAEAVVVLTPTPTIMETEDVAEIADVNELRIMVLNASGIPGKAKEVAQILTDGGFLNVETENLEGDYIGLTVTVDEYPQLALKLMADLAEGEQDPATGEMDMEAYPDFDAIVVFGK